jgi:GT2 family glycosyltransferase
MTNIAHRATRSAQGLQTFFELVNGSVFVGSVADPARPTERFTVELLVDGLVIMAAYADQYTQKGENNHVGDGCHGFAFQIPQAVIENAVVAEARVANLGIAVGSPVFLSPLRVKSIQATDHFRWLGGLRFSGWVADESRKVVHLTVAVDGAQILQVSALGWAQAGDNVNKDRPARAFDFQLPERFADGCVRWVNVSKDSGEALSNGRLPFVAFPDGLAAAISGFGELESERLRGEMYDHLIPMSLPMSQYEAWQQRFPLPTAPASSRHCAVVLVGQGPIEATLDSLENQTHGLWAACALDDDAPTSFEASAARTFLSEEATDSDFVVFALAGTVFEPNALRRILEAFSDFDEAVAVYGDTNVLAADGGIWPLAFPAFDYERLLEQGYCAHLFALRRDIAESLLDTSPSNLYRLFNALFDQGSLTAAQVIHVPGALGTLPSFDRSMASAELHEATELHLKIRKIATIVTSSSPGVLPAVRVQREQATGRTTIIIPTRDRLDLLRDCLTSIEPAAAKSGADILIIDNDSTDQTTLDYLAKIAKGGNKRTRCMRVPGPFNFAKLNNIAARAARSDYLCLLNNDVQANDSDWLDELLGRMAGPEVGAVGALLLWPSGVVQHGGVVLGPNFAATHAFNDRITDEPGYGDLLQVAHECSAVTAACLLTRRADYLDVGGMDEIRLAVSFNDVDYCLRLREAGKRIILTPHARLTHLESASRAHDSHRDRSARFSRELQVLRSRWGQVLIDDPYYNPTLSLDAVPFSALAWPPRRLRARSNVAAVSRDLPPGF